MSDTNPGRRRSGLRWALSMGLVAIATAVGAALAAFGWPGVYESEALVRLQTVERSALGPDRPIPEFEGIVEEHLALAASQAVTERALQDPSWKANWLTPDAAALGRREVHREGRSMIRIRVRHHDALVAATAARAAVTAYATRVREWEVDTEARRYQLLREREAVLRKELGAIDAEIDALLRTVGTPDVRELLTLKMLEHARRETALDELKAGLPDADSAAAPIAAPAQKSLESRRAALESLRHAAAQDAMQIGATAIRLDDMRRRRHDLDQRLQPIRARLDDLQTAQLINEPVTVVSIGEIDARRDTFDWRPPARLIGGAAAGGAVAIVALCALRAAARRLGRQNAATPAPPYDAAASFAAGASAGRAAQP